MYARKSALTVVLPLFVGQALGQSGLELDVNSQDSIKSAAKSLAGGIVAAYDEALKEDRIPGLFGDDTYFWEAGTIWNAMVEYSHLTGDHQYDDKISQALQWQVGDFDAYMPANQTKSLGNDDQSCWGLAAMNAAEVGLAKPKNGEWLDYATNVWNTQTERLDIEKKGNKTCAGGLRWQIFTFNNGYDYKNSFTNGNYFLLSARLAKFTGNETYSKAAEDIFKWSQDKQLVSEDYQVLDGTTVMFNCTDPIQKIQFSSNIGVYTEGAALMHNITGAQKWTDAVKGFVNSSSTFLPDGSNVITETACEKQGKCDQDMHAYKGVFARTLARAALAAPVVADSIKNILTASAKAAASACKGGDDVECSMNWVGNSNSNVEAASDANLSNMFSALEVIQGLLYPSAKGLLVGYSSNAGNTTQTGGASGVSGSGMPQATGAAASIVSSMMAVCAVAFAAVLSF